MALGITATKSWKIEDLCKCPPDIRSSGWELDVEQDACWSIENLFNRLRSILDPVKAEILRAVKRDELRVQFICVIEANIGNGPEVILSTESIKFIYELGAELNFDLYYDDYGE